MVLAVVVVVVVGVLEARAFPQLLQNFPLACFPQLGQNLMPGVEVEEEEEEGEEAEEEVVLGAVVVLGEGVEGVFGLFGDGVEVEVVVVLP